ncbi:MAG: helix-turn-helix domain-containing protein [Christensenellales bacterium]
MTPQEVIQDYRNEVYKLTQREMAQELNMSLENYKKIEQGKVELKFDFVIKFINTLSKLKVAEPSKLDQPISFFSFLYQIDNVNLNEEYQTIELALNNVAEYPKYIDARLFEDCFDYTQPMYRILYSYPKYSEFLNEFKNSIDKYRKLYFKKKQLEEYINDENINSVDNAGHKKQIIKPLNDQKLLIRQLLFEFLNDFLEFYCNPTKKPTAK